MVIGIILAAGKGTRLESDLPKQFIKVEGKPLFQYSLIAFEESDVDQIYVVASNEHTDQIFGASTKGKVKGVLEGGFTRQESVENALDVLEHVINPDDIVLVHDSARPLITKDDINRIIADVKEFGSAVACDLITDTIVEADTLNIRNTLNRDTLRSIQTPQGFIFKELKQAHKMANKLDLKNVSDDSQLMKLVFKEVHLTPIKGNIKITTKEDLNYFQFLIQGGHINER